MVTVLTTLDAGEDAVKVNSKLLRIAISDETSLEFLNRFIGFAFDSEDEVAMHQIGAGRHVSLRNAGPRLEGDETGKFLIDSFTPIVSVR
jgi:hypothetical protein